MMGTGRGEEKRERGEMVGFVVHFFFFWSGRKRNGDGGRKEEGHAFFHNFVINCCFCKSQIINIFL